MLSVIDLEGEVTLATSMHWVPLKPLKQAVVTVTGRLEGEGRHLDGAALMVAEFEPSVATADELAGSGLYLSEKFGPFAYLQSNAPDDSFSIIFTPPGGRIPSRLGLRLFRSEHPLKLLDLKVALVTPESDIEASTSSTEAANADISASAEKGDPAMPSTGQIQWLDLPDTIGNRITVAGPWQNSPEASSELLQVAVDLDTVPKDSVLAANGLMPPTGDNSFPTTPVRSSERDKAFRAVFSVPDGSALMRVGLVGGVPANDAATISRAIFSPREGDVLVNISVDTEALPGRATNNHVDTLIYGRNGDGEYGISLQMRVFREFGVPATFYLECGQCALWGAEAIADVGKRILDGGFDLQLHLHSELVARAHGWKWTKPVPPMLHNLDRAQTFRAIGFAVEHFHKIAGQIPDAFRAGSYLFGPHTLEALREFGVHGSSNYRADQRPKNAYDFSGPAPMRPFKWSNGVLEFPITLSPEPLSALTPRECWRRILHHVQVNRTWVVNVVIHSWSFMHRDKDGHQVWRNSELMDNLIKFIELAPAGVRFASTKEIVEAAYAGTMDVPLEKDIGSLVERTPAAAASS